MSKVVKFGGSSLADAKQFKKVYQIIKEDKERKFVVPSAPGLYADGGLCFLWSDERTLPGVGIPI